MKNLVKKYSKIIVILIGITMILPMLIIDIPGIQAKESNESSSEISRIASEISNMTGVEYEEVIKLKNQNRTWNDVLNLIKNKEIKNEDKSNRNNILTNFGIEESYVAKLKEEGYSEDEIIEAKLIVERVIFQLNEITKVDSKNNEDDLSSYMKISENIDTNTAVYCILKLKNELGSAERALDEYITSLQLDINIELYFIDTKNYEKEKNEKIIGFGYENIITLTKIEEKMLEKLQKANLENENIDESNTKNIEDSIPEVDVKSVSPEIPNPNIKELKPSNPNDEIMNEIKAINPNDN